MSISTTNFIVCFSLNYIDVFVNRLVFLNEAMAQSWINALTISLTIFNL